MSEWYSKRAHKASWCGSGLVLALCNCVSVRWVCPWNCGLGRGRGCCTPTGLRMGRGFEKKLDNSRVPPRGGAGSHHLTGTEIISGHNKNELSPSQSFPPNNPPGEFGSSTHFDTAARTRIIRSSNIVASHFENFTKTEFPMETTESGCQSMVRFSSCFLGRIVTPKEASSPRLFLARKSELECACVNIHVPYPHTGIPAPRTQSTLVSVRRQRQKG